MGTRFRALLAAATLPLALAACTAGGGGAGLEAASVPSPAPVSGFDAGTPPTACPPVTQLEGTSILRREAFVASIAETTRDCRVYQGRLYMHVGVAGRVMPTGAGSGGTVQLPVRVAVTRGSSVLYSTLGAATVTLNPAGGAQTFSFVDRQVAVEGEPDRTLRVLVGFDEGPGGGGSAPRTQ